MAKGDLKILLTVETKQLQTTMNNVANSISNLNKSSSRKLKTYKKEMDEILQKSRELEQYMSSFFKTPQKGGYWKHFIKETQDARKEIEKTLNAFDEKGVIKLNFDYNSSELTRIVDNVESKIGNISGSGNTVLAKYNQNINKVIENSKKLQQATKEVFSSPQDAKTWVAYTGKLNEQMEKVSQTVEGETQRAFRDLRYELIQTGKIANQSMPTKMFQKLYKETRQGTVGLEKMNQRLIALRDSGFLTDKQFADLNRQLVNLGAQSKRIEEVVLASRRWNSVLDKNIKRVALLRAKFGSYVDLVTRSVYKINFLMTQAAQQLHTLALYVATVMTTFGGLKVIDEFEKLDITLQKVTGSMTEYSQSWDFIKEFAVDAPQNIREISDAFIKLKAYGLEPTNGMLRAIIDTVAALGGDERTLNSITRAFGQIQAKGRLMGQEVRQLADANIPIYTILNEKLGITKDKIDDIGNQSITASEALAAMQSWLEETYGGTAAARMDTLSGRLSNLGDVVSTFLYEVSQSGGAVDYLKNQIKSLTKFITDATSDTATIRKWGRILNNTFTAIVEGFKIGIKKIKEDFSEGGLGAITSFISNWVSSLRNQSKSIEEFIGQLIASLAKLKVYLISFMGFGVLAGIANAFASMAEKILRATKSIGQFILGIEAIKKLNLAKGIGVVTLAGNIQKLSIALKTLLIGNPIGLVVTAITTLVTALWKYVPEFRNSMGVVGDALSEIGRGLLPIVGKAFKAFGVVVNTALGAVAMTAVYTFGVLKGTLKLLSGDIPNAVSSVQEGYQRMNEIGKNIAKTNKEIWTGVTEENKKAENELSKIGKSMVKLFEPLQDYEPIKEIFETARLNEDYSYIKKLTERMKELNIIIKNSNGEYVIDVQSKGYKDIAALLNEGRSLTSALSTLEVRAEFAKQAIGGFNTDQSQEALGGLNSDVEELKEQLQQLEQKSQEVQKYLQFNIENEFVDTNMALVNTNRYFLVLRDRLRDLNLKTEQYKKTLYTLSTEFTNIKIDIFNKQLDKLENKIETSRNKINQYKDGFEDYSNKINKAIDEINQALIEQDETERAIYLSDLENQFFSIDRQIRNLKNQMAQLKTYYSQGMLSASEFDKRMRELLESESNALLEQKEIFDTHSDVAKDQENVKSVLGDQVSAYKTLRSELTNVRNMLDEVNSRQVTRETNAIQNMQKDADTLEEKIKKLNQVIANIQEAKIQAIVDDAEVLDLEDKINKLDGKEITMTAKIVESVVTAKKYGGLITKKLASGGWLPGYGGGDKIKALLEAGEFVVRKEAVKKFGLGFLQAINNMSLPSITPPVVEAPKTSFATGGLAQNMPSYGTINLAINGQQFPIITEKDVADKLMKHLNKQKRVSL